MPAYVSTPLRTMIIIVNRENPSVKFELYLIEINIPYFPEPWVSSKVQCVKWWMGHYQSKTPKRHYAYGNTCVILGLDRGRLRKWKPTGGVKTVTAERYVDSKGKKRYKGTSKLRSTEKLGSDSKELLEYVSIYIYLFLVQIVIFLPPTTSHANIQYPAVPKPSQAHLLPRHYPMPFARAVTDQIERMKMSRRGCPELPASVPTALHTITCLEWPESSEFWQFAGLKDLYFYLRGAASLEIPEEWKPYIPKELGWAVSKVVGAIP